MKKFIVLFSAISGLLTSLEYVCVYEIQGDRKTAFEPVIVDLVHDALLVQYYELFPNSQLDSSSIQIKAFTEAERKYTYDVAVSMDLAPYEMVFLQVIEGIKKNILSLDEGDLKELVLKGIQKKVSRPEVRDELTRRILSDVQQFDLSSRKRFVESLKVHFEKKEQILNSLDPDFQIDNRSDYVIRKVKDGDYTFEISASEKERRIIRQIISDMGSKSLFALLRKRSEMMKLGDQIRDVPPMEFLAVIFSQNDLKQHMGSIRKSHFKWKNIVDEIGENMAKERKKPDFEERVRAFAESMGADGDLLVRKAEEKDWSGFISALF
jgi:hypothetical protein